MKKSSSKTSAGGGNNVGFFPPSSSSLLNDFANMHLGEDDVPPIGIGLFPKQKQRYYEEEDGHDDEEDDRDNMDVMKGYGLQSHQHYDQDDAGFGADYLDEQYDEDDDEHAAALLQEDKAPEMPTEYYEQVESFLKRPPPSLTSKFGYVDPTTVGDGKKKKTKKTKAGIAGGNNTHDQADMLPPISPQVAGKQGYSHNVYPPNHFQHGDEDDNMAIGGGQPPRPPSIPQPENGSGDKKKRKKVGNKLPTRETSRNIDHSLLREAFAYTDLLLREAVIEEVNTNNNNQQQQQQGNNKARSAPIENQYDPNVYMTEMSSGGGGNKSKKASGAVGMVRNLKSNKSVSSVHGGGGSSKKSGSAGAPNNINHGNDFQISTDVNEPNSRRSAVNYDDLVSNFQNGTTLEKLKRELAQSQAILHQSQSAIRELSGQYYQPKGKGK